MLEKIHCDLLEIFGPDWGKLSTENIECIAKTVDTIEQFFGEEPNLYGFVGTKRINNVVGGYFAMQYSDEEYHYNKQKDLKIIKNYPFEHLFFILFPSTGKLLLQNSNFVGIPLNMSMALGLFRSAFDFVLEGCGIYKTFNIALAPKEVTRAEFIREFESSSRVIRIEVISPNPDNIPEDYIYYNPQRERNSIIRGSHRHDYPHLKKVDLEAPSDGDLKQTHLADLIYAGTPETMRYFKEFQEFFLRRSLRSKFEFHLDKDVTHVSEKQLYEVIEKLRRERAVILDTPTAPPPQDGTKQLGLFDVHDNSGDDNDDKD